MDTLTKEQIIELLKGNATIYWHYVDGWLKISRHDETIPQNERDTNLSYSMFQELEKDGIIELKKKGNYLMSAEGTSKYYEYEITEKGKKL